MQTAIPRPTLEQVPDFLVDLLGELQGIKSVLQTPLPNLTEIEKPTDVEGAAEHTNLDYQTIYKLVRHKKIPYYKQGRKLYFYRSELNDWIKSGKPRFEELKNRAEVRFLDVNKNRRGNI